MSVASKIKFRLAAFSVAAFIVIAWAAGIRYALLIAVLVFLSWKAYPYMKMMRFWKGESSVSRQMIEYVTERLNEGSKSKNLWVQSLTVPEVAKIAKDYRVELMARQRIIEKQSSNVIEGWTEWGGTRLQECVLQHPVEELGNNVGTAEHPIPLLKLFIAKAAFEILVAEHALQLLNVPNPREITSRRGLSKELEYLNTLDPLTRAFTAQSRSTVMRLLAKELEEPEKRAGPEDRP